MHKPFKTSSFKRELNNILTWWAREMLDHEQDGFIGRVDANGVKYPKSEKAVILNTRILWTFSAAWNAGFRDHEEICHASFQYIINHFVDQVNGGLFWMLDYQGHPINKRKQVYAQAFGIYALTEYHKAFNNQEALYLAVSIFKLLEEHALDPIHGGYLEAFGETWNQIEDVRLSSKDENDLKTMNTHLHILEAYTNLYRYHKDKDFEKALQNLVKTYVHQFIDNKTKRLKLFFDEKWNENINHHSFGHEIESVWLIHEAVEVLDDHELLEWVKEFTIPMAHRVLMEGMSPLGGIFNEKGLDGHYDGKKDWWPQAEAVIGFFDAWQKTQNIFFLEASKSCWEFIQQFIIDQEKGEWHWGVEGANELQIEEDKAGPWKAPYHNARMCLEMIRRLD